MRVLLAIGEPTISSRIRIHLEKAGFEIEANEVLHRKYLDESIQAYSPSMIILHDLYLPTDLDTQEQRDEEMLHIIEHWRTLYDSELRVVYLCVRERTDPFLAQLVARNVLDIFYERALNPNLLIAQLAEAPRFANVKRFGTGTIDLNINEIETEKEKGTDEDTEVLEEENEKKGSLFSRVALLAGRAKERKESKKLEQSSTISDSGSEAHQQSDNEIQVPSQEDEMPKEFPESHQVAAPPKTLHEPVVSNDIQGDERKIVIPDDISLQELIDLMPEEHIEKLRPRIIGTVLIAVASVKAHLGCTNTALTIASYLAKQGYKVAICEANYSEDFERIHALLEGEKSFIRNERDFEHERITHYKYRGSIDLGDVYAKYDYVVMDYGELDEVEDLESEFHRAHQRVVVCPSDDWKFHWIQSFLQKRKLMANDNIFISHSATAEKIKDLQRYLNHKKVWSYPIVNNPYEVTDELEQVIVEILSPLLQPTKRKKTSLFSIFS